MHDYAYFGKTHGANPPELQVRIATFQSEIVVAMDSNVDEVFFFDILPVRIWACPSCLI